MTFAFAGYSFPAINEHMYETPPEAPARISHYWGLSGDTEIRSGGGSRLIHLRVVLRDNYPTYAALAERLRLLHRLVNTHGSLHIVGTVNRSFANCTFLGFSQGQDRGDGPLPDIAGTMGGGWWIRGVCTWRDLGPAGVE